jgi:hypothetical protein
MQTRYGRHAVLVVAQTCRRFVDSKAVTACLTTSLVVTPRSVA